MGIFSKLNKQLDEPATPHPFKWWHIPLLLLLIGGTIYVYLSNNNKTDASSAQYLKCEGKVFGTIYHITYNSSTNLQSGIDSVLAKVDSSLSPFNKESIITAVNNNQNIEVDKHFQNVFNLAKTVSAETNGAFDITVAPLVNAWGFGFKNKENITDELIQELLTHVGFEKVSLKGTHVEKTDTATLLDCSAIAKGYGVDAVGDYLESVGIKNYMVEIGGEVRVRGYNDKSKPWNIGIMKPVDDATCQQTEIEQVLSVTNLSMATSGNYRNFYEEGNKKYAHTINPKTGYPVQHSLLSSTVLATDCATADAYATAFMVVGIDEAKKILNKHPELKVFFIYSKDDGTTACWHTDNLNKYLVE